MIYTQLSPFASSTATKLWEVHQQPDLPFDLPRYIDALQSLLVARTIAVMEKKLNEKGIVA